MQFWHCQCRVTARMQCLFTYGADRRTVRIDCFLFWHALPVFWHALPVRALTDRSQDSQNIVHPCPGPRSRYCMLVLKHPSPFWLKTFASALLAASRHPHRRRLLFAMSNSGVDGYGKSGGGGGRGKGMSPYGGKSSGKGGDGKGKGKDNEEVERLTERLDAAVEAGQPATAADAEDVMQFFASTLRAAAERLTELADMLVEQ